MGEFDNVGLPVAINADRIRKLEEIEPGLYAYPEIDTVRDVTTQTEDGHVAKPFITNPDAEIKMANSVRREASARLSEIVSKHPIPNNI